MKNTKIPIPYDEFKHLALDYASKNKVSSKDAVSALKLKYQVYDRLTDVNRHILQNDINMCLKGVPDAERAAKFLSEKIQEHDRTNYHVNKVRSSYGLPPVQYTPRDNEDFEALHHMGLLEGMMQSKKNDYKFQETAKNTIKQQNQYFDKIVKEGQEDRTLQFAEKVKDERQQRQYQARDISVFNDTQLRTELGLDGPKKAS